MKISIVTAVYNSVTTVCDTIASVTAQTYPDIEHVIVEGLSTDGSLAAIERASHDRMLLISEQDRGIYDALNKGVARSTGDIIGFTHSDDFLPHERSITRIAEAFLDPTVEAVFSDLDYVAQSDTSRIVRRWVSAPFHPRLLKYGWMPPHPTLYLRRDVYERHGGYDINLGISADYDFILRYFSQTPGKSVYIPEVLYKMRLGGVSNRNFAKVRQKMGEDYLAIRRSGVGGFSTLALKNLSKINQFIVRQPRSTLNISGG